MKVEVSRPHYHPDKDNGYTKKRDLSVPPHWVANERVEKDGVSYAVVMPPRPQELYEMEQPVHIHIPERVMITVNGIQMLAKVKVQQGEVFAPVVHFDHITAEKLNIKGGEEATL